MKTDPFFCSGQGGVGPVEGEAERPRTAHRPHQLPGTAVEAGLRQLEHWVEHLGRQVHRPPDPVLADSSRHQPIANGFLLVVHATPSEVPRPPAYSVSSGAY